MPWWITFYIKFGLWMRAKSLPVGLHVFVRLFQLVTCPPQVSRCLKLTVISRRKKWVFLCLLANRALSLVCFSLQQWLIWITLISYQIIIVCKIYYWQISQSLLLHLVCIRVNHPMRKLMIMAMIFMMRKWTLWLTLITHNVFSITQSVVTRLPRWNIVWWLTQTLIVVTLCPLNDIVDLTADLVSDVRVLLKRLNHFIVRLVFEIVEVRIFLACKLIVFLRIGLKILIFQLASYVCLINMNQVILVGQIRPIGLLKK